MNAIQSSPAGVIGSWHDENMRAVSPSLIARTRESQALRQMLAETAEGQPRTVVIAGEAGIGKTRLLAEFKREASVTARVLVGECVDLGMSALPYAAITGMLHDLLGQVGADTMLEAAGPGRDALAVLLPELRGQMPEHSASGAERLHEVVAVLLENISRAQPLVIVVEDLHWADGATLAVLRFLQRTLADCPIMIVLSYRSDDVHRGHPLRGFLSELERSRRSDRLELRRLTLDEVGEQIECILGHLPDPLVLESVYERSDGVPFFVEELLSAPESDELPDTLRDLLLARYERLSTHAQSLLRLLSAGGVAVRHDLLMVVAEAEGADLDEPAREAVLANVLVITENSYAFRHALVREAVHAELLPGERVRFHSRYAAALENFGGIPCGSTEVANHWLAANNPAKALVTALEAMHDAQSSYAYITASQMGERALNLWDQVPDAADVAGLGKVQLLALTASNLLDAGDSERAIAIVDLALAEPDAADDDVRYARLLRDKASYLATSGRPGSAALLEQALELVPPGRMDKVRASMLNQLASRLMVQAQNESAIEVASDALTLSLKAGTDRQASIAANLRGVSRVHSGEIDAGLADLERAGQLANADGSALLRHNLNSSDVQYLLGNFTEALALAEAGMARARELGVERSTGIILSSNAVDPLFAVGDWDRADNLLERALAMSTPTAFNAYLRRAKLWSLLWRGELDAAVSLYRGWRSGMAALGAVEVQVRLTVARVAAEIALEQGDLDDAWQHVAVLIEPDRRSLAAYDLPLLSVAARVLVARGASDADIEPFRRALDAASGWPTYPLWSALFDAELADDVPGWQRVLDREGPAHVRPYALYRLGQAQFAAGDRQEARDSLRQAADVANTLGARLITRHVNEFSSRAGLTLSEAPRPAAEGPELTARERQVLDLIAQGLSNRQIGERLFISAKTASVHVSAILRKLGATSRTEAVFVASQGAGHAGTGSPARR